MNVLDKQQLDEFFARERIEIQSQNFTWGSAWNELLQIALYNQGPEISEIGSTWIGSLLEMNALAPVSARVMTLPDMEKNFYPGACLGVLRGEEKKVWGIPWLADTRVIYYRKSWLKKAGVNEKTAFKDTKALMTTLKKLQNEGCQTPLTLPTTDLNVIYNAAPWLWEAGGSFRTSDGHALVLTSPKSQAGLHAYFSLHHFLSSRASGLRIETADVLFREGEAAVAISGPWLFKLVEQDGKYFSDLGVAKVPGVPFVGGTHLVIWAHSLLVDSVVFKFVKYLTSREVQTRFVEKTMLLPARADVLASEPFASNPFYQTFAESLRTGRVIKISYRWAAVERHLHGLFASIWADLAKNPDLDLKQELYKRTETIVSRLNKTILFSP